MKIVNKTKFIKSILILIFSIIFIIAVILRINEKQIDYVQEKYVVQKGDTLWNIASEYASEHQDLKDYIYQLKQVNNIASSLEEGQSIIILK